MNLNELNLLRFFPENFWYFQSLYLQKIFFASFSTLLLRGPRTSNIVPQVSRSLFIFLQYTFSFSCSDWMISMDLATCSLTLSSPISNLLLGLDSEFLLLVFTFKVQNFHLTPFYSFHLSADSYLFHHENSIFL